MAIHCKREHPPPVPRLASIDRSQLVFLTVDVERLIDDDHSARSIWQLLRRVEKLLSTKLLPFVLASRVTIHCPGGPSSSLSSWWRNLSFRSSVLANEV
jgi:hypothetical protein